MVTTNQWLRVGSLVRWLNLLVLKNSNNHEMCIHKYSELVLEIYNISKLYPWTLQDILDPRGLISVRNQQSTIKTPVEYPYAYACPLVPMQRTWIIYPRRIEMPLILARVYESQQFIYQKLFFHHPPVLQRLVQWVEDLNAHLTLGWAQRPGLATWWRIVIIIGWVTRKWPECILRACK